MGVSIHGDIPIAGGLIMENPIELLKWMIWGYPYFRKPSRDLYMSICIYILLYLSIHASIYASVDLPTHLSKVSIYQSIIIYHWINLSIYPPIQLSTYSSIQLSTYPPIHPSIHLYTYPTIHLPNYPSIHPTIHPV